jgi:hypothetical protein
MGSTLLLECKWRQELHAGVVRVTMIVTMMITMMMMMIIIIIIIITGTEESICKYLGIEESFDTQHKNEKEKLKKDNLRLRLVLGTELSAKNKIQAIGSLAV